MQDFLSNQIFSLNIFFHYPLKIFKFQIERSIDKINHFHLFVIDCAVHTASTPFRCFEFFGRHLHTITDWRTCFLAKLAKPNFSDSKIRLCPWKSTGFHANEFLSTSDYFQTNLCAETKCDCQTTRFALSFRVARAVSVALSNRFSLRLDVFKFERSLKAPSWMMLIKFFRIQRFS